MQLIVKGRDVRVREWLWDHFRVRTDHGETVPEYQFANEAAPKNHHEERRRGLAKWPSLIFLNRILGGMNMIFRSTDGNIICINTQIKAAA